MMGHPSEPAAPLFNVNLHSFRVARLEVFARDTAAPLGEATGFFCRFQGRTFLVTNWHVVSGRHFQTRQALHRSRALPGTLTVHAHVMRARDTAGVPSASTAFRMPLLGDDGRPRWHEHPLFGADIDVIALDIGGALPLGTEVCPIDLERELAAEARLAVMDQAFVTGFPLRASTTPNSLPIYKSGTIASEPAVFDSQPRIYIDGKTKTGMSGSPVMVKRGLGEGRASHDDLRFIGVYSGRDRQEPSEFEAELGIVWPFRECLLPILESCLKERLRPASGG
ncbi:MAG: trypsin-like peptidase domain-containing protein [Proteobacteria bacterium]|nr:trypsin-like peptidase domain-containing protein [Pseudomonadota bacterium]